MKNIEKPSSSKGCPSDVARGPGRHTDYARVFMHAPDAMLIVDDTGAYVDANEAAERLTGYSRAELLTKRLGDLTGPSERHLSAERFAVLRSTGRARRDRTILRKDGTTVPVEAHAVALGPTTYQTTLRDISKRRAQERELERSLAAYETLHELCGAAVISADREGHIKCWNAAAAELFGYSEEVAMGMSVERLIPERFIAAHRQAFAAYLDRGRGARLRLVLPTTGRRSDGAEVPIEITIGAGWQDDEPLFTAVVRDATEQRATLDRLNDALRTLRFHIERMPLAHIVWDRKFRVQEWNPAAERIFGYSRVEALGRHAYDLMVPKQVIPAVDKIWADLLSGDTSSHSINSNLHKDGSILTCEWFNTPLRDARDEIRGVASMVMDITERNLVEQRLRDAQKLESLGVLASGVAHDFNNTLMVILGNCSLLRSMKTLPSGATQFLEMIEEAGLRASELIRHLLAYARTGRHNPEPTDLNAVIDDARLFLQSSVGKDHTIEIHLAQHLPPTLADKSQLDQILLNLCANARQAMDDPGVIVVETQRTRLDASAAARATPFQIPPGDYVELTVRDTGHGMDEQTVRCIFDPFFTTKREGHGLGLAAVSGILRQHRAGAYIESRPGRGTCFHVYFPVHASTDKDTESSQTRQRTSASQRRAPRSPRSRTPRAS